MGSDSVGTELFGAAAALLGYLGTFWAHSTLLIAATWLVLRVARGAGPRLRERAWRVALVGAVFTAAVTTWTGLEPLGGRLGLWSPLAPAAAGGERAALPSELLGVALPSAPSLADAPARALLGPVAPRSDVVEADRPLWVPALAALWALGAAVGIARLLFARRRLQRDLVGRRSIHLGPAARSLAQLQRGRVPVRLSASAALAGPIAFGVRRPEICLSERALRELSPRELEATLAHELGHLVRRDPLWLALAHAVCALFWFQPLLAGARRELMRLAELQADRFAARQTGEPLALASALTRVAAWWSAAPVAAAHAMAGARFALAERVECLLDGRALESAGRGTLATPAAAVLLVALVTTAPAVSAGPTPSGATAPDAAAIVATSPGDAGGVASTAANGVANGAANLQRELAELELGLAELGVALEGRPELQAERAEFALLEARFERIEVLREELETLLLLRAARRLEPSANDVPNANQPPRAASPIAR